MPAGSDNASFPALVVIIVGVGGAVIGVGGGTNRTKILQRCTHFNTIQFNTIAEIKPSESARHEEQATWN